MPLPKSWDHTLFTSGNRNLKAMVSYARERAKVLGEGSSRIVFDVRIGNKHTALKIPMNRKGDAQQLAEIEFLKLHKRYSCIVPLIDYDAKSTKPRWIQTAKAQPLDRDVLYKMTGLGLSILAQHCAKSVRNNKESRDWRSSSNYGYFEQRINNDCDLVKSLKALFKAHPRIEWADLETEDNWGMVDGKPVLIDIGYTTFVRKKIYGHS